MTKHPSKGSGKTAPRAVKHAGGRPPKYQTPEAMQRVIDQYFEKCDQNKEPYTMSGLAYELDMSRRALIDYKKKDEFLPTIKKARRRVEVSVEKLMLKSSGVVAGVIFNAKNNFGWKDKKEQDITSQGKQLEGLVIVKDADSKSK